MFNRFGTTSDMIIQTVEEQGQTLHLAIDAKGLYLTSKNRIDTGLADTNRYTSGRESTMARLRGLGLNPEELFSANQHLVQAAPKDTGKRVNPLKAAKRASKG